MKRYGCTGCSERFDTFEEALPHHDQITGHNICTPPIDPCPQCARFREKMDREKMAKVAYEHMFPDRYGWEKETDEHLLSNYRNLADHYIKYLTE